MAVILVQRETAASDWVLRALREVRPGDEAAERLPDLQAAFERLARGPVDLILLDLDLDPRPDLDDFRRIQGLTDQTAVVLLVNADQEDRALAWIHAGAQDFLIKDESDPKHLVRALRVALERRHVREQLSRLAQFDPLTLLPNRVLFLDRLRLALARSAREGIPVAVLFLDLDRFKLINDTLGHPVGDRLLRAVADRLAGCVRRTDTVARMAGDEFTAIVECPSGMPGAASVAEKIRTALSQPFRLEGHVVHVGVSIGIAMTLGEELDEGAPDRLVKRADLAMYRAKGLGGNTFQFHSRAMSRELAAQLDLERDLQQALARSQFELHWQPQFDLPTGALSGLEGLLRWQHPERGLLHPGAFLRSVEDLGLAEEVGAWVLRTACRQAKAWETSGLRDVHVAVNLSSLQLRHPGLPGMVRDVLEEEQWEAGNLELEFSESALMALTHGDSLSPLAGLGIRIALDDFGAGYSSLQTLRQLPLHTLKLDPSFAQTVTRSTQDAAVATAAISFGHALGLRTVAEGIETADQLDQFVALGCQAGQGYHLHPPEPADRITAWLRQRRASVVA